MLRAVLILLFTGFGIAISLAFAASPFDPPVKPEFVKTGVFVIWHETNDVQTICGPRALACAFIGDPCTIYTYPQPAFDSLGHELLHCLRGRWH
jgi:hypothetical protein